MTRIRDWWSGRTTRGKVVWSVVGVLVALGVLGAIAGGGGEEAQTPVAAVGTETPDAPAADPVPAEPVDTGRMSQGEWERARDAVFRVNGEISDYRTRLGNQCSAILGAGEVSNALDCIEEAYDGVEGGLGLSDQQLEDLQGDVAGKCLKALTIAADRVNVDLFQAVTASKRALDSLDNDATTATLAGLRREANRWSQASGNMLQLCAPS